MNEAGVAVKLKEKNRGWLWVPTPDKFGTGIPDRILLLKGQGCVVWVELKFLRSLPKNRCKVGLKRKQAGFLGKWKIDGGNSALIVGVADENKVAIFWEDFSRIAIEGVTRQEFELVDYASIGKLLKEKFVG